MVARWHLARGTSSFSYVMSNSSDTPLSLDANGDTASVTSSESTEANSDSKADLGSCMLWFKFTSSSNFFKLVHIFQTSLFFFGHLSLKKGNISIKSSILFSPILTEFLLIYSIPQLLYPFPQIHITMNTNY